MNRISGKRSILFLALAFATGGCDEPSRSPVGPLSSSALISDGDGIATSMTIPQAVFLTTPRADEAGVIVGPLPLEVEFNMCRSRPGDEDDDLKFTYDWNGDGTVDWFGHCRRTESFTASTTVDVCVSDRRPGHEVCRRYEVRPGSQSSSPGVGRSCGGPDGQCLVFITSTTTSGNIGGLAGADAMCQARANVAGLGGTYRAWLSDGSASPAIRFARSTGRYVRVDGVLVAAGWADLTDGTLVSPIDLDEFGARPLLSDSVVYTHTLQNGTAGGLASVYIGAAGHCQGWTDGSLTLDGDVGAHPRTGDWTATGYTYCSSARRLYCFEQE